MSEQPTGSRDPTQELLAPRKRRRSSSSSGSASASAESSSRHSSSSSRRRRHRSSHSETSVRGGKPSRLPLLIGVAGVSALVVLAVGLVLWIVQPGVSTTPPRPPASIAELLAAPPQIDWRWRRLASNEAVLVIEFPTLAEQGRAMNRLAALHEKSGGQRDRVLDDAELAALIEKGGDNPATFFMGHDYPAAKLARFFSLAQAQRLTLNAQELKLREQLLVEGVIRRESEQQFAGIGEQAVVSFTALSADDPATPQDETVDAQRRASVLRHELSHGEFFTVLGYRQQSMSFWTKVLTEAERARFRDYLASIDYDPLDEELMANETQALLLHTPDTRAFKPADVGLDERGLEALRERFRSLR